MSISIFFSGLVLVRGLSWSCLFQFITVILIGSFDLYDFTSIFWRLIWICFAYDFSRVYVVLFSCFLDISSSSNHIMTSIQLHSFGFRKVSWHDVYVIVLKCLYPLEEKSLMKQYIRIESSTLLKISLFTNEMRNYLCNENWRVESIWNYMKLKICKELEWCNKMRR